MLGFGNDNKDQLKENMEEIKDLINQGKRPQAGDAADLGQDFQDEGFKNDDSFDNQESDFVDLDSDEDMTTQTFSDTQGAAQSTSTRPQAGKQGSQELQEELESFDEEFGPEPGQETVEQPTSSSFDQDIPEPAKTREIDVPEIERGPLFIRRRKFERAREMVTDMLYLSQEVEGIVNDIESGIQSDSEMERDVRELVQAFEANRSEIEEIISPGEK